MDLPCQFAYPIVDFHVRQQCKGCFHALSLSLPQSRCALFPGEIDDGIMLGGHVGIGKITLDRLNRKPCFFQQQLHFMAKVIG